MVSDRILGRSREAAQNQLDNGGPVWAALLKSFAQVEKQCTDTWKKVAEQVPEILARHVLVGQVGVFLAALYQLMCTQQQGITSMVVAQARVPVHLGVHSWATQAALAQLFAQVILGLGSLDHFIPAISPGSAQISQLATPAGLVQYTPIPPDGSTMVSTGLFPRKQIRSDGTANCPILLGNVAIWVRMTLSAK